jgi:DNA-binding CsgD family transcriptional regulator
MPQTVYFAYELRDPTTPIWRPGRLAKATIALGLHPQTFYVGKSQSSYDRLDQHVKQALSDESCRHHKCRVIRRVLATGARPLLVRISSFSDEGAAMLAEMELAARYPTGRLANGQLPDGTSGWSHRPEVRAQMSASRMGHSVSEKTRAKLTQANRVRQPLGLHGREDVIRRLINHESPQEIAVRYGVTRKMIELIRRSAWNEEVLPRPESRLQKFEEVVQLYNRGYSTEQIASALGCSARFIWGCLFRSRQRGLVAPAFSRPRPKGWQSAKREDREAQVLALHKLGLDLGEIALRVGYRDRGSVRRILIKNARRERALPMGTRGGLQLSGATQQLTERLLAFRAGGVQTIEELAAKARVRASTVRRCLATVDRQPPFSPRSRLAIR